MSSTAEAMPRSVAILPVCGGHCFSPLTLLVWFTTWTNQRANLCFHVVPLSSVVISNYQVNCKFHKSGKSSI